MGNLCSVLNWETFSFFNCFDVGNFLRYKLGKICFNWENWEHFFKIWNNLKKNFLLGKLGMVFETISWKILVGRILLLGIFLTKLVGKNFVGNIGNILWKCYLGKFCLGILVIFWKCYLGKKFLFGKIGNILLGKILLLIFVEDTFCLKIWKVFL